MSKATRITTIDLGPSIECTTFTHYDSKTRIVLIEFSDYELNPALKDTRRSNWGRSLCRGQMYGEDGTRGIRTGEFEFAVMGFGDPLCDGKAEAGSPAGVATGASLVGAEKSFEDA